MRNKFCTAICVQYQAGLCRSNSSPGRSRQRKTKIEEIRYQTSKPRYQQPADIEGALFNIDTSLKSQAEYTMTDVNDENFDIDIKLEVSLIPYCFNYDINAMKLR